MKFKTIQSSMAEEFEKDVQKALDKGVYVNMYLYFIRLNLNRRRKQK